MKEATKRVKAQIEDVHGKLEKVGRSGYSLFRAASGVFIYFRYSAIKTDKAVPNAFFGLLKRDVDKAREEGDEFYVCFVTDNPESVFSVPFADFAACYDYAGPASDGQYKTHIRFREAGAVLYIPESGNFAAEPYRGLKCVLDAHKAAAAPELDHASAQSLVGAIGMRKGHSVWFPRNDLEKIDRNVVDFSQVSRKLPSYGPLVDSIFQEIDVVWLSGGQPAGLFEVEHSTPIYSGLLRINDILLEHARAIESRIVADQSRRDLFQRQIRRPTFHANKLEEKVSFISYDNLWRWSENLKGGNS